MRRSLSIALLAVALPLSTALAETPDPVAAIVNGVEIHRSDLEAFLQTLPEQYRQMPLEMVYGPVLDRVIDGKLLSAKAEKDGLPSDPEVEQAIAKARELVLRDQLLRRTYEAAGTEAALQAAYEAEKQRPDFAYEEVNARHILVASKDEADKVLAELDAGRSFAELAKESSTDPGSKDKGGDLGWFRKEAMVAPFAEAAFTIPPGTVGKEPVQTEFGWHVIEVVDKRTHTPSFEEMRPQLQQIAGRKAIDELLVQVREGAEIKKFGPDGKELPATPATP